MDNSLKNSAKYLIGIIVLLLILATVFFGLANKKPAFDPDYVMQLIEDNKSLGIELQRATLKNTEYESTIALMEEQLAQQASSLAAGDSEAEGENQALAACVVSDDVLAVQKRLIDTQSSFIACTNDLNTTKSELSALAQSNENLQSVLNETQLAALEVNVLEDKLAIVNTEYADLEARFNEILLQNQELVETITDNAPLSFENFVLTPQYCNVRYEPEWVCVESIDIDADFNFAPEGDLSVRLIDPSGDVIGRKKVVGRESNRIQFVTSRDDPLLVGQYMVEFRIDGIFTDNRSFELGRP